MRGGICGAGIAGFAALLALAMIPSESGDQGLVMYGMVELVHTDAGGDILSSQSVHNQLLDSGEDLLIRSVFNLTSGRAEHLVDTICVTDFDADGGVPDDVGRVGGDAEFLGPGPSCIQDDAQDYVAGTGIAAIGPLEFVGGTNMVAGATVDSIVVCHDGRNIRHCNHEQDIKFSVTDVPDTVVNEGDVISIEYTFDVSSPDT